MNTKPKFKIGDHLLWVHSKKMIYDYRVNNIDPKGFYILGTLRFNNIEQSFTFDDVHKNWVLYDSPQAIWLRL